mgnify:CR=1 FL=1
METKIQEYADLQQSMDHFANNIEDALNMQRESVLQSSNRFKETVASLHETKQSLETQLAQDKQDFEAATTKTEVARKDNKEAKSKYEDYQIRKNKLMQMREQLEQESAELDDLLAQREQLVADFRERLQQQTIRDNSEVSTYEQLLGMGVNASRPGVLEFTFRNFSDADSSSTCSIVLDVSGDAFQITQTSPELSKTTVEQLESTLNTSSSLPAFIVQARDALVDRVQ